MAATLFWMDVIRNRLASYSYKSEEDKKLIIDFMVPIVLVGKESERDLAKSIKQSLRETKRECGVASRELIKELRQIDNSIKVEKAKCVFCGKLLNRHKKTCVVKPCDL